MKQDVVRFRSQILLVISLLASQTIWGEIIPTDRRTIWANNVGIPGGIPTSRTVFTTVSLLSSETNGTVDVAGKIINAISSCPPGQEVVLPAGKLLINSQLLIQKSMTLRGAGMDQTIIYGNYSALGNPDTGQIQFGPSGESTTVNAVDIISGNTQGSSQITLSSTVPSGLHTNYVITIDQLNDNTYLVIPAGNQGAGSTSFDVRNDGTRVNSQTVIVTAINGSTVSFWPPLVWTMTNSPQMVWWSASTPTNNHLMYAGLEDLTVQNIVSGSNNCPNVYFNRGAYCWARNVKSVNSDYDHFRMNRGFRYEVRRCYITNAISYPTSTGYGINVRMGSSFCLIEDNIAAHTRDTVRLMGSCVGNVIIYNYCTNQLPITTDPTWDVKNGGVHASHPMFNLWEGNINYKFAADNNFGSSSHNTLARSWMRGPPDWAGRRGAGIDLQNEAQFYNVVGNVLGRPNIPSAFTNKRSLCVKPAPYGDNYFAALMSGYWSDSDTGSSAATLDSAQTWPNHIVAGNYDYVANKVTWINPSTPDTIPPSYYYSSKPAYFGNLTWPPIDPVAPTVGETVIPAGYRYLYGTNPPPGLAPPTGIRVVGL